MRSPVSRIPRVIRSDWSSVAAPALDGWRPALTVSVVIPAFQCQPTLDLTLASLSRQTYPADLLEVIVVDDGSDPPLVLPAIRPERTLLVRVGESGESGWGRANALRVGVAHSSGEILHWLDADMVAFPEHVAAQARWHHVLPYAVTLGYKRFVDQAVHGPWPSAEAIVEAVDRGAAGALFGGSRGEPHSYVERYIKQTAQLRIADHLAFRIHTGATAALRREMYDAAGGLDPQLRLGEDTEFGYRLAQAGAVFVPEPHARSWHLGRTNVMRAQQQIARRNHPFLAARIPQLRYLRKVGGTAWPVPLVEVVMVVGDKPLERVRAAVDLVLGGTEQDIRINLVGPWNRLDAGRVPVLTDPRLELRLIAATYRGEPRVRLVTESPVSAFPAPYLLELPAMYGVAPDAIRRLIDLADRHQVGSVCVGPPGGAGFGPPVLLWRTAALSRAQWVRSATESLLDAATSMYGHREVTAAAIGIVDLAGVELRELVGGAPRLSHRGQRRTRWVPTTVDVHDVRSLVMATVVVTWLLGRRLMASLRAPARWRRRTTAQEWALPGVGSEQ
jgi:glycosyltransferase involved in cell wall biosynthesis